jgi:hypothetical protein
MSDDLQTDTRPEGGNMTGGPSDCRQETAEAICERSDVSSD